MHFHCHTFFFCKYILKNRVTLSQRYKSKINHSLSGLGIFDFVTHVAVLLAGKAAFRLLRQEGSERDENILIHKLTSGWIDQGRGNGRKHIADYFPSCSLAESVPKRKNNSFMFSRGLHYSLMRKYWINRLNAFKCASCKLFDWVLENCVIIILLWQWNHYCAMKRFWFAC